ASRSVECAIKPRQARSSRTCGEGLTGSAVTGSSLPLPAGGPRSRVTRHVAQQVGAGGAVTRGVTGSQLLGDAGAVLGRLVAAVLHLGANALDVEPDAADAGQLPPVLL